MEKLIAFGIVLLVIFLWFVTEELSSRKFLKERRAILTEGRKIIFFACVNKEFDDWKQIASCVIVDCRDEYFKCEYSDGTIDYIRYTYLGEYDDKVEVYDGDTLVMRTGFALRYDY